MKRTSVVYNVQPSHSHNPVSDNASRNVRKNSVIVQTVGIILIVIVIIFITKHAGAALLAGAIIPGNPFDEVSQDEAGTNLVAIIIGIFLLALLPFTVF